jgi:hypothetical protein
MNSAICRVSSVISTIGTSISRFSVGTSTSMSYTCRLEFPRVRGMWGLTCAITSEAFSAALRTTSTETPRLHRPSASGGVTWIKATSIGNCPVLK